MIHRILLSLGAVLLLVTKAFALPFKCDKQQILCEVQTKRLTIGDKVGIFASDGQLAAIGEVSEIRSHTRVVKITQKWGALYRTYSLETIEDEKAKHPEQYFRVITPLPEISWGVDFAVINLGVGDSFLGSSLEGGVYWLLWRDMFLTGRLHYITGAGKASDNLGGAGTQAVSISSFGASVGVSELLAPYQLAALRLDADLGFSNAAIDLPSEFNKEAVLNSRMHEGPGIYFRVGVAAIWRRDGLQPELGFNFLRLHSSNNPSLFIGVSAPID